MRSWIFNLPVSLTEIMVDHGDISQYLAIESADSIISEGDIAIIWGSGFTAHPGIMGYGIVLTQPLKPTAIPEAHRKLYQPSSLQVGIRTIHMLYQHAVIPAAYAYHLPSLNEAGQPIRIGRKPVYWGGSLWNELQFFMEEYNHLFRDAGCLGYNHQHYLFALHLLRERYVIRHQYGRYKRKLESHQLVCAYCHTDLEKTFDRATALGVMELHERRLNISGDYQKIDVANFELCCPTCHKAIHTMIRNEKHPE